MTPMTLRPEYLHLGEGWITTCERIIDEHPDPDVRQLAELLLLIISLEREVETLKAAVTQHRIALRQAIAVIQSWHDLGTRNISKEEQARMWQIYRDNAPEMRAILAALSLPKKEVKSCGGRI